VKPAAGAFLGGAASRLLPASIPFRFFGSAVVFQGLAWLALMAGADGLPRFVGGLGWPLAGLHLITLGVLVMSAIGASLQLLPVATRQPVRSTFLPLAIWWLYTPGVAAVAAGMGLGMPALLAAGAVAVLLALLMVAALLARNLLGARGMTAVVAHGWAALACLGVVLTTALSMALAYVGAAGEIGVPLLDRTSALPWHLAFAGYGFMGLLALGLSYILVPMFALSAAPDERQALHSLGLAIAALLLAAAAALDAGAALGSGVPWLRLLACALGLAAVALHLVLMFRSLRSGMRRELGGSFILVRFAWACLPASLLAAAAITLGSRWPALPTLFGLLLIGGWLLGFLLGILQRILPFLASMHVARGSKRPPTPGSLTDERALAVHRLCHFAALAGLALAIVAESGALAALAAGIGAVGAAAFARFYFKLRRRMAAAAPRADGARELA